VRATSHPSRLQRGFSLIELMVGVVLALIAVIVVMQIFQQSEKNKRTTTGSSSASMDGAVAFTDLQRDLRQGGMGFSNLVELGCSLTLRAGVAISNIGPVTINPATTVVPAGDANTDTLLIVYANGNSSPEGDTVSNHPNATTFNVNTPSAFTVGNYVVSALQQKPTPCTLVLDKVVTIAATTPGSAITTATGNAAAADTLYDWGLSPRVVAYRVSNGRLQQCDYTAFNCSSTSTAGAWLDLVDGVVSLRALYGRDTSPNMTGFADTYDQTTPASTCGWARTEALRLALTLRSGQLETSAVTGTAVGLAAPPTWSGAASAPIDVTGNAQWAQYRYKVYESLVPLRNMAWIGAQTSCNGIF
jgi:type IV pilus assembly protein PilW